MSGNVPFKYAAGFLYMFSKSVYESNSPAQSKCKTRKKRQWFIVLTDMSTREGRSKVLEIQTSELIARVDKLKHKGLVEIKLHEM